MLKRDAAPAADIAPHEAAPIAATAPGPEERRRTAWVGKSVVFTGDLTSSEDLMVDGRVEGTIEVRLHTLTIGPDADIRANVTAARVVVLGTVTGSITATDKVDIRESGVVHGDISSAHLKMAEGAILRGRVQ
jgi:cytoskeletal protein CcmA (bactofilin family)